MASASGHSALKDRGWHQQDGGVYRSAYKFALGSIVARELGILLPRKWRVLSRVATLGDCLEGHFHVRGWRWKAGGRLYFGILASTVVQFGAVGQNEGGSHRHGGPSPREPSLAEKLERGSQQLHPDAK